MPMSPPTPAPDNDHTSLLSTPSITTPASPIASTTIPLLRSWDSTKLGPAMQTLRGRHALGAVLILVVIAMWTTSNFLSSFMFADETYSKPFFVTYANTASFIVLLPVVLVYKAVTVPEEISGWTKEVRAWLARGRGRLEYAAIRQDDGSEATGSPRVHAHPSHGMDDLDDEYVLDEHVRTASLLLTEPLHMPPFTVAETAWQSFIFSWLWFAANYAISASLEYSSVATSTVLTSCSGLFTLAFGYYLGVHNISKWKLGGVIGSVLGIFLIYYTELFGDNSDDHHRGDFPDKTNHQMELGAFLALLSAAIYGYYACLMKKNCVDETRINMLLFFGFVGLFNVLLLWPLFVILHYTALEPFLLPPSPRLAAMVLSNSLVSGTSDILWASAVLLTSPVLVTVGLSLSIPLALVGQFFTRSQTPTWLYVVGTILVMAAVLVVEMGEREGLEGDRRDGESVEGDLP